MSRSAGFTLAEILVVVFLFSITVVILSQTYLSFIRLSHRTANAAVVQQDMRFVLEYLARNVRNTPINYPALPSALDNVTSTVSLKAPDQTAAWIMTLSASGDARCGDEPDIDCLLVSSDGGTNWAPITAKHVNVETFKVYIRPQQSPFVLQGLDYVSNQQPFATVQIKLTYMSPNVREKVSMETQTTISSRVYVR